MKPIAERESPSRRRSTSRRSRRGNIALLAALSFFPIVGAIGLGVDYTRLSLVKSEMQRAADAAALAGARILNADGSNGTDVESDALMYFWGNYRQYVADATINGGKPSVAILDPNRDAVRVTANATVPMAFGNFIGSGNKTIQVQAQAQRAVGGMEVVMVLDNTGSMSNGTRMADLKTASKDLVEILYGEKETKELQNCAPGNRMNACGVDYLLTVGIVPFNMVVNIGPISGSTKGGVSAIVDPKEIAKVAWGKGNGWKGCVFARGGEFETTRADATPAESPFSPYVWKSATSKWGMNPWGDPETWPQDDLPPGLAQKNFQEVGRGHGRGLGPNLACGQPITPLQPSKSVALEQIDSMDIGRNTGTVVPVGLAWGWRLLAPNWRPYWAGGKRTVFSRGKEIEVGTPAGVPRDYNTRNFEKVIVLFTDGMNVVHANASAEECCTGPYGDPKVVRDTMGGSSWNASIMADTYTLDVCRAIKAKGVKIYVVLLYPNAPQWLLDLYNEKGCASGRNFFFHASTSTELRGIFNTVGTQLKNLRLVQ